MQCVVGFQAHTFTLGRWSLIPTRISKRFMTQIRPRFCDVPGDMQLLSMETRPSHIHVPLSLCTQTHMYTRTHTQSEDLALMENLGWAVMMRNLHETEHRPAKTEVQGHGKQDWRLRAHSTSETLNCEIRTWAGHP